MSRQVKELRKLLTGNGEIDITQKASIPMIDNNNLHRETLHTKLRKRFHLEPLKQLVEKGYISDCVMIEVKQVIDCSNKENKYTTKGYCLYEQYTF